eukprot:g428.t1
MVPRHFDQGTIILKEDDQCSSSDEMFLIQTGSVAVIKEGQGIVATLGTGKVFGELAMLYNCTRTASIIAETETITWAVNRKLFRGILKTTSCSDRSQAFDALSKVDCLASLVPTDRLQLADVTTKVSFQKNEKIITLGDKGTILYFIIKGSVRCSKPVNGENTGKEKGKWRRRKNKKVGRRDGDPNDPKSCIHNDTGGMIVLDLGPNHYFGERALLNRESKREANVIALENDTQCLALDKEDFDILIDPIFDTSGELRTAFSLNIEKHSTPSRPCKDTDTANSDNAERGRQGKKDYSKERYQNASLIQFTDLRHHKYLGEGSFGVVRLVSIPEEMHRREAGNSSLSQGTVDTPDKGSGESKGHASPHREKGMDTSDTKPSSTCEGRWFLALKEISKAKVVKSKVTRHVIQEKRILQAVSPHPFIIELVTTFKDSKRLYMLLEFVSGGELYNYLQSLPGGHVNTEYAAAFYASSIVLAFEHIHNLGYAFRDLKPENILIDRRGYPKLIDFGFAKRVPGMKVSSSSKHGVPSTTSTSSRSCKSPHAVIDRSRSRAGRRGRLYTVCGTPEYIAPEIVSSAGHDHAVDLWGIGVLLFELLFGRTPFITSECRDVQAVFQNVLHMSLEIPHGNEKFSVGRSARDIIQKLLVRRPNRRLGMGKRGMQEIKSHSFFKTHITSWEKLYDQCLMSVPWYPYDRVEQGTADLSADEWIALNTQHLNGYEGPEEKRIAEAEVYNDNGAVWDQDF